MKPTEPEWLVMNVLWDKHPATAGYRSLTRPTGLTCLSRLHITATPS
jgi:predicted transcriptional regulator